MQGGARQGKMTGKRGVKWSPEVRAKIAATMKANVKSGKAKGPRRPSIWKKPKP